MRMNFTQKHKFLSSCIVARDCIVKTVSSSRFPSKPDVFSQVSSLAINNILTGRLEEGWRGEGSEERKRVVEGVTTDQTDPQVHLLWTSTTFPFIHILWLVFSTVIHPTPSFQTHFKVEKVNWHSPNTKYTNVHPHQ